SVDFADLYRVINLASTLSYSKDLGIRSCKHVHRPRIEKEGERYNWPYRRYNSKHLPANNAFRKSATPGAVYNNSSWLDWGFQLMRVHIMNKSLQPAPIEPLPLHRL